MYIRETDSTNTKLRALLHEQSLTEGFIVRTDFQTSGKGQKGNSWESERGKNLLFSILLYPTHIPIDKQFIVSQLISIAIKKTLDQYSHGFLVKWPNDIYYFDKKIGGILIENIIQGSEIKSMIVGIGLNINQIKFESDAPNPVSLMQITGKRIARIAVLNQIYKNLMELYLHADEEKVAEIYAESLYCKDGFHRYSAGGEEFEAKIIRVHPDGKLELETTGAERREYYFKEVSFVL